MLAARSSSHSTFLRAMNEAVDAPGGGAAQRGEQRRGGPPSGWLSTRSTAAFVSSVPLGVADEHPGQGPHLAGHVLVAGRLHPGVLVVGLAHVLVGVRGLGTGVVGLGLPLVGVQRPGVAGGSRCTRSGSRTPPPWSGRAGSRWRGPSPLRRAPVGSTAPCRSTSAPPGWGSRRNRGSSARRRRTAPSPGRRAPRPAGRGCTPSPRTGWPERGAARIWASLSALRAFWELGSTGSDMPPTRKVCGWGFLPPRMAWTLITSRCQSRASR